MQKTNGTGGAAAALAANIIFGFSFIFSSAALKTAHPVTVLAARFTVSFLFMSLLLLLKLARVNYKGKPLGGLLLMCTAQPLLYFLFELYGLKLTSSAISGIITALVPVVVTLLSAPVLGEKPNRIQILCCILSLLSVTGVSLLGKSEGKSYPLGILLLFCAVISAAAFNLLSRGQAKIFSPFERTYFMFAAAAAGFNIIGFAVLKGGYTAALLSAFSSLSFTVSVIYLGIISSCAAFLLYNYATSRISATRAAAFSNILTVISVLSGILILKEPFSVWQLLLCIPILIGVFGVNVYEK